VTLNLAVTLEESAKAYPDKTALILEEHKMSYTELRAMSKKFAGGLVSVGVKPGDKVALMAPNVPQWVAAYYGILNMGATGVPLNVLLKAGEVAYHLEDSDAVALVVWEDFLEEAERAHEQVAGCKDLIVIEKPDGAGALEGTHGYNEFLAENPAEFEMVQTDPNDTAVLVYTSGTTGRPKGAELTHFNVLMNVVVVADWLFKITEDDVALGALPLFNVFGQNGVLNSLLYKGATVALLPRFEPEAALETIQRARVTMFHGVPTMYQSLLRYPNRERYDTSSLRQGVLAGAAMPAETLREFEEQFGVVILEGYGLSETTAAVCSNRSRE
jgi:long-chain acyl-CoA synthetase